MIRLGLIYRTPDGLMWSGSTMVVEVVFSAFSIKGHKKDIFYLFYYFSSVSQLSAVNQSGR